MANKMQADVLGGFNSQAAQDAYNQQLQAAQNAYNQQAQAVLNSVNQQLGGTTTSGNYGGSHSSGNFGATTISGGYGGSHSSGNFGTTGTSGSGAEPSSWANPSTYSLPTYDTTGVNGNTVSAPGGTTTSGNYGGSHSSGSFGTTDPNSGAGGGYGNTSDPWGNAQPQQDPGYIDPAIYNVGPYVNPFGNDAQLQALNDYYNQMGQAWADWGEQAMQALQANAAQLATTPGAMEAAQAAIERQLADALSQLKANVNAAASAVINNPVPDSGWTQPSGGSTGTGININLPGITLPSTPTGTIPSTGGTTGGVGDVIPGTGTASPSPYNLPDLPGPNPERVNHVDTTELRDMLQQLRDMQVQQGDNRINYAVQQGVNDLNRAMEDAAKNYQTQRNQVAADEANALDNQALYAEARGDRGGIGAAQYASIQNTAAQNRRAVNDAQVKLGTDTARQIADLRAQGEFEKADQLLSIAQSHMSQLANLEQWALGTNVGVDEFNSQLQQWVDEYNLDKQKFLSDLDLSAAQLTGMFSDGTRTYEAEQALISSLANSGNALLQMGIMPSRQQLQAMGMTEDQAQQYVAKKSSPLGQLGLI